jgi:hypothetical protein
MLRPFTIAALAAIAVLMTAPRVGAGVLISQAAATTLGGPVTATAAHGFIMGNDVTSDGGDPLLGFLNSGSGATILTLHPDGNLFKISSSGMFGSIDQEGLTVSGGIIDVIDYDDEFSGFNPQNPWVFASKQNFEDDGSFNGAAEGPEDIFGVANGNTISLISPLAAGSYVLSLKGGGGGGGNNSRYAVFLFENVGEISSFTYNLEGFGLSHASLFRVGPDTGHVPEPASLAVFGFGALLGVGGLVRRRFPNRKGFALRGLAA